MAIFRTMEGHRVKVKWTFQDNQINQRVCSSFEGAMSGGFNFQVTDGLNFAPRQIFSITARALIISLEVNRGLSIFPGKRLGGCLGEGLSVFLSVQKIQLYGLKWCPLLWKDSSNIIKSPTPLRILSRNLTATRLALWNFFVSPLVSSPDKEGLERAVEGFMEGADFTLYALSHLLS